ncbi:monocarboxylate transporter 13-like [Branchiostoma floridae x Branchiostoma japonicum]
MSSIERSSPAPETDEGMKRPSEKRAEAPDGGWGWCVVLAGFTVCFCTAGTIRSLGVFFLEFVDHFDTTYGRTSWITSITLASMYGGGPLASLANRAVGPRCAVMLGGVMSACGCMFASFSTRVVYVYLTLGVMTGKALY